MRTTYTRENINKNISIEDKLKDFDIDDDIDELSKIFEEIYKEKIDKTSNSNKNLLWCYNCNNNEIIEDTSLGIYVCKTCGIVLNTILDSNPEWRQYDDDNE
jgi:ribosomal protein S27E